jgi:hypothetical protein
MNDDDDDDDDDDNNSVVTTIRRTLRSWMENTTQIRRVTMNTRLYPKFSGPGARTTNGAALCH